MQLVACRSIRQEEDVQQNDRLQLSCGAGAGRFTIMGVNQTPLRRIPCLKKSSFDPDQSSLRKDAYLTQMEATFFIW